MAKSILARQPDGTVQLTITIPKNEVKKAYDEALAEIIKTVEIPGFRKGKAPKKLAEEKADKTKVYEQVLQKIVPQAYIEAIKENKLSPITTPKVELLKAKEGEDWEFRATTCETPEINLGNYKDEARKALAPTKIWTPGTQKAQKETENTKDEKTQKVIQALLQIIKFNLPEMLIEDEVNRTLANLINQTEKLGLTIDQYLTSIGKSAEQIRQEYREKVSADLKLQFILNEIAETEKLNVSDKEIEELVGTTGDEAIKKSLENPLQKSYLKGILLRRKALDFLTNL